MLRTLVVAAILGSCVAPAADRAPTVSVSACQRDGAPVVRWYVVGRGHEVWLHSGSTPMMVANATAPHANRGTLPGAWNIDRRTVDVLVSIDGSDDRRTLWATAPC